MAPQATDDIRAEAVLAAIGLDKWLRAECRFGVNERDQVRTMGRRLNKEMLTFLTGEQVPVGPLADITWQDAQELLFPTDPQMEEKRALSLVRAVRAHELALAVQNVAERALQHLQMIFPRTIRTFMAGDRVGPPNRIEWQRFRQQWEVACSPETVMQALREGTLADDQVGILETLYPALYAGINQAATDAVVTMKAKRPKWFLELPKERQLAKLRQEEAPNLALGFDVQAMFAGKSGGKPNPPKGPPSTEKSSEERLTPGQKSEEA